MKITKIIFIIIFTILLITTCNCCQSYAKIQSNLEVATVDGDGSNNAETTSSENTGGSVGLPNLDGYAPQVSLGTTSKGIISKLLGALTVLGVVIVVVSIALIGFSSIMGSASEKAFDQQKIVGVVIGAIIITFGSLIARVLISVAETL